MKRRDFIQTTCRCALLCASPVLLSTLQSCEDVEADSSSTDIIPPIDTPSDTTSTGGNDSGGNTTPFYAIDLSSTDYQSLQTVGNSVVTPSNTADPSGLILYRSSDTTVRAFSRYCTHAGGSVGSFVNGTARCSTHGAQFDTSGNVVGGPARSALKEYLTSLDGTLLKVFYAES